MQPNCVRQWRLYGEVKSSSRQKVFPLYQRPQIWWRIWGQFCRSQRLQLAAKDQREIAVTSSELTEKIPLAANFDIKRQVICFSILRCIKVVYCSNCSISTIVKVKSPWSEKISGIKWNWFLIIRNRRLRNNLFSLLRIFQPPIR